MTTDSELVALAGDVDARSRLRGEFASGSGARATEYCDRSNFEADPVLLARVVDRRRALVPAGAELPGGPELGGVPLATPLGQGALN